MNYDFRDIYLFINLPIIYLINYQKTSHTQGKSVIQLISTLFERSLQSTAVITAARGRGKSAALGLAVSAAIAYGYESKLLLL